MEYKKEINQKLLIRLRTMQKELPYFTKEFFRAISERTSIMTRLGYAYDLKLFFYYLITEHIYFVNKKIEDITIEDIENIEASDIEEFMEYLSYYIKVDENGIKNEYHNEERGKLRKLSAVRALFRFLYKREKIKSNPSELVDSPKIHEKYIIRLEPDEVSKLIDEVEIGDKLTERQQKWHEHTKIRDVAIITLLLGTGIRVSECVGIDINNIDFDINGVKIIRKGGNETFIYFGKEVEIALKTYIEQRKIIKAVKGNEEALFLSMQHKRINVRTIQKLVKKYSQLVTLTKNISPHKLRSTYGTNLYRQTGDIYLVADVLGHKDVNTTRKHYAEIDDNSRRKAAQYIKLRK